MKYGEKHQNKTISRFWKYIYFIDEAHFNSRDLASKDEYILRQPDNQIRLSNFNKAPQTGLNITLHVATNICYNYKGEIIFYNDLKNLSEAK